MITFELQKILDSLTVINIVNNDSKTIISSIHTDSRKVTLGSLFVAIKGPLVDGHEYILDAVRNGAVAIVLESDVIIEGVTTIRVKHSHEALISMISTLYSSQLKDMDFVGITGTNGKTTCAYLLHHLFTSAGHVKSGVIGTTGAFWGTSHESLINTTPGPMDLVAIIQRMYDAGVRVVILEVSSHALDQKRVEFLDFFTVCFTNLTQDHLDYHKDMHSYFCAKSALFFYAQKKSISVINADSKYGQELIDVSNSNRIITYGLDCAQADVYANEIVLTGEGSSFVVNCNNQKVVFHTSMIGRHNIYNLLAVVSVALGYGLTLEECVKYFVNPITVPGRLQLVSNASKKNVFVDYAHTDDALKNVLLALREVSKGKIICVFGCGGDRDKAKRPKMGAVVSEYANTIIITNDNPRTEDPMEIIRDIKTGINAKKGYFVIPNRANAIQKALAIASKDDCVLIAGKGHEDYQIIGTEKIHFSDVETVMNECQSPVGNGPARSSFV